MPFGLKVETGIKRRDYVVEVDNLVKTYEKRETSDNVARDFLFPRYQTFRAVDDISLKIKEGEIYGLLGPNGAGKTTTIKMLVGLLTPKEGRIIIDGRSPEEAWDRIGVMFGFSMIYYRMTGYDNLKFFGKLYKVPDLNRRIRELSSFLELGPWLNSYVEHYSSGMKSKLALARALLHDPDILFLDEPTLGLDPKISIQIRQLIKDMDKTVIITTHYMEEANDLCDRIGIMNSGKLIREDTPANLKKLIAKNVAFNIGIDYVGEQLLGQLEGQKYIHNVELSDIGVRVLLEDKKHLSELLSFLSDHKITTIKEEEPSLIDVFVRLTGGKEGDV